MRTLYLDCSMGAAGDMLTAALYELLSEEEKAAFIEKMNGLGLEGLEVSAEASTKCGIVGTHMTVTVHGAEEESVDVGDGECGHVDGDGQEHTHEHTHEDGHHHEEHHEGHHHESHGHHAHHHSSMADIEALISELDFSERVKSHAKAVYELIAEAESSVHGKPVGEIHFHEVGTMDAVADVVACCYLLEVLEVERVIASPVHVGSGQVRCAHGILPVPAPATAYILRDVPIYGGEIRGELCTPTGAALLKHFAYDFDQMPMMTVEGIGYGMGKKDFPAANCVRAMLGEMRANTGEIIEYTCNVDDMTAERVGFAMERLFEAGAVEVYTVPIGMKKSRPGLMLCVMARESKRKEVLQAIFKHTTTLGVRENVSKRYFLERRLEHIDTEFGEVQVKISEGYGVTRRKLEYEDLARIARENDLSLDEVARRIEG